MNAEYPGIASSASRRTVLWFYRGPEVAVNSLHFHSGRDRFAVTELDDVIVTRGPVSQPVVVSVVALVAAVPVIVPVMTVLRSVVAFAVGAAALFVPLSVAIVGQRLFPREHRLIARYRGREVVLFKSSDEREFGQVSRALMRAIDRSRSGRGSAPATPDAPAPHVRADSNARAGSTSGSGRIPYDRLLVQGAFGRNFRDTSGRRDSSRNAPPGRPHTRTPRSRGPAGARGGPRSGERSNVEVLADLLTYVISRNDRVLRLVALMTVPAILIPFLLYYIGSDPSRWLLAALAVAGTAGIIRAAHAIRAWQNRKTAQEAVLAATSPADLPKSPPDAAQVPDQKPAPPAEAQTWSDRFAPERPTDRPQGTPAAPRRTARILRFPSLARPTRAQAEAAAARELHEEAQRFEDRVAIFLRHLTTTVDGSTSADQELQ